MSKDPLYHLINDFIENKWECLRREQLEPWFFMTAGPPFSVKNFYGQKISYQGIDFSGSPCEIFWNGYIEPFLKDIVKKSIEHTIDLCGKKNIPPKGSLETNRILLKGLSQKAYRKMTEIDQRLRGKGFPEKVAPMMFNRSSIPCPILLTSI